MEKLPYFEAKKRVKSSPPTLTSSFASVALKSTTSCGIQCNIEPLPSISSRSYHRESIKPSTPSSISLPHPSSPSLPTSSPSFPDLPQKLLHSILLVSPQRFLRPYPNRNPPLINHPNYPLHLLSQKEKYQMHHLHQLALVPNLVFLVTLSLQKA